MINGSLCGFFKGQKGLKQGDPISPLLFVLCMEYLSRTLKEVAGYQNFKYFPDCRDFKICHIRFADDFILFCDGDYYPIFVMLRGFATFSEASGLTANKSKSEIYRCNMDQLTTDRLTQASGFRIGSLPFKYLGVPISSKRLKIEDCEVLTENYNENKNLGLKEHVLCS